MITFRIIQVHELMKATYVKRKTLVRGVWQIKLDNSNAIPV